MPRPKPTDYPAYYENYISKVEADSLHDALAKYAPSIASFITSLPQEKADFSYAPGKWTLKEVVQHIIDAERVFSYRLMRIARQDKTPLASFEENDYVISSNAQARTLDSLKEELLAVRKATDLLVLSLTEDKLSAEGNAATLPVTANAVGYIIFGHLLHHQGIIAERYLK